ncbi:MAG TPA: uroporphyrinogen decarboxylase family protein [Terriglobia bacterium]|nr:uroporphyrinogen decarboxylase family protein [Terriglobia bacterium]
MAQSPLTQPLSPTEQEDFRRLFNERLEKVRTKTADVFAFRKLSHPPFIVNAALYSVFGLEPETFPDTYFDDPVAMTNFQERTYYDQVKEIEDDFVPYLMPWFGTGVVASAFGCQIQFSPKQDPAVNPRHYPVQKAQDVRKLSNPNPERDGLMPKVLEFLSYMKQKSFLPVGITDFQGPLTTANQLMGYDKLIYLMQDNPMVMHELMDKVAETLIRWVRKQKEAIGEPLTECISDQQVYIGEHGGVWFSDDDAVLMSPRTYKEFVVPYNSRILKTFGGGCLHYCGNATHQAENFLRTEGLLAINNYTLYDIRGFRELKSKLEGRIVLFACDFTPVEYEHYFKELLDGLSFKGLVVDSQFTPRVGLVKGGKYLGIRRDLRRGRRAVHEYLRCLLKGECHRS